MVFGIFKRQEGAGEGVADITAEQFGNCMRDPDFQEEAEKLSGLLTVYDLLCNPTEDMLEADGFGYGEDGEGNVEADIAVSMRQVKRRLAGKGIDANDQVIEAAVRAHFGLPADGVIEETE